MAQLINRNAFARTELWRNRYYNIGQQTCAWCGQCKHTAAHKPYLYQFWEVKDSINNTKHIFSKLFCSTECFHTYNS